MKLPRPCIDCGTLTSATRCSYCQRQHDRNRGTTTQRMGSGWATISRQIIQRDGGICQLQLPGCQMTATTVDHLVPRIESGSNHPDNLQAACRRCNSSKGARVA